jgi:hypothetical protein
MKKKIPLVIHEVVEHFVKNSKGIVKAIIDEGAYYHLVDIEESSDFYFKISNKQEARNDGMYYAIEFKPKRRDSVNKHSDWVKLDGVKQFLGEWINVVADYNNLQTPYDDPIIKSYEDEFVKQFDILDEDAGTVPFTLDKQLFLDQYLATVDEKLQELKKGREQTDQAELTLIQAEANSLKKDLPKLTKRKVVKRLARIWAKSRKVGLDVLKDIFINVAAEITKHLLLGG